LPFDENNAQNQPENTDLMLSQHPIIISKSLKTIGAAWLSMVRRGSVWCGVAQYGAAWLRLVRRG
jgi:hypothetical protein